MNPINRPHKKFPIGLSSLKEIRKGYYYVDKSPYVALLADRGKYYFLSRPRRFGKSLLLDTIKQAFLGEREAFKDLYLEHHWDWSKQYPVIHINLASTMPETDTYRLSDKLSAQLQMSAENYGLSLRGKSCSDQFAFLIQDLYAQHQATNVVILIDEYDKPILDVITDLSKATEMRNILRGFYSVIKEFDDKIHFVFLTGVSKFSKAGVFSGLNNLNDITYHHQYAAICGYTQKELEATFQAHIEPADLPKIKAWYNGYHFLGKEGVYNPFSILHFFEKGKRLSNYWFASGTPTFLIDLMRQRQFYIPQLEKIEISESDLDASDIETLPLPALLLQTGYLTIQSMRQRGSITLFDLTYPNLEVRLSFNDHLSRMSVSEIVKNLTHKKMDEALRHQQADDLKEAFTSLFASIPHDWYRNNDIQHYEGFYCATIYTYFMGLGYQAIAEDVTSQGKIDLTIILDESIIILEFKLSKHGDALSALQQIKNKGYADKYLAYDKPIYLLGLSFNTDKRNVEDCVFQLAGS